MKNVFHEQIVCAGFGGQGIMLMGKLLAEMGMNKGFEVSWLPSYGAEVRGGTAHSMVHITDENIASPTISKPTTCIVMNKPSLAKFMGRVTEDGLLIINTSMVDKIVERKSIRIVALPLTDLASGLGNIKVANMIAIGAFINLKNIFSLENAKSALKKVLPPKNDIISINEKALKKGYESVK